MKKILTMVLAMVIVVGIGFGSIGNKVFANTTNSTIVASVDSTYIILHTDLGSTSQNVGEVDFFVNGVFKTSEVGSTLYVPNKFDTTLDGLTADTDYSIRADYLDLAGNVLWSEDLGVSHTTIVANPNGLSEDNNDPNPPSDTTVGSPSSTATPDYREPLGTTWDYYPMASFSFIADSHQMGGTFTNQYSPIFLFSYNTKLRIKVKGNVIQNYNHYYGAETEVTLWEDDGYFGKTLVKSWEVPAAIYDQNLDFPYASTWEDGLNHAAEFIIEVQQHYQTTTNRINIDAYSGV